MREPDPDKRAHLRDNLRKWREMSPEQRDRIRERVRERRQNRRK